MWAIILVSTFRTCGSGSATSNFLKIDGFTTLETAEEAARKLRETSKYTEDNFSITIIRICETSCNLSNSSSISNSFSWGVSYCIF